MNLVIPLKNDNNYEQLRYAMRSITTHHEIHKCFIVGGRPDWYTGNHIIHKDYSARFKEHNIRDKVLTACLHFPGEFLFANDDHILLQPINEVYNKGLLSDCLRSRAGHGSYTRCLRNTMERYGDVDNVDTHCPMVMDAELVSNTGFDWPDFGIGFKTCYAQENGISSVYMDDCKTDKIPQGREWFSMTDIFPVRKLAELFPIKSKFEI